MLNLSKFQGTEHIFCGACQFEETCHRKRRRVGVAEAQSRRRRESEGIADRGCQRGGHLTRRVG